MSKKRERETKEQNGSRKRKSPKVSGERRPDRQKGKETIEHELPGTPRHVYDGGSPFYEQRASFYLSVSPVSMSHALEGVAAEHLSPLLLTYYPPLDGVLLSYEDVKLQDKPREEDPGAESLKETVTVRTQNEAAAGLVWVSATFTIFRPEAGSWIDGFVNVQNEGHIGIVCWNLFNASIARDDLPSDWRWIPAEGLKAKGPLALEQATGYYINGEGKKIDGKLRFIIKDFEIVWDRERAFIALEGDLSDHIVKAGGGLSLDDTNSVMAEGIELDDTATMQVDDVQDAEPVRVYKEIEASSISASEDSVESTDSSDESETSSEEDEDDEDEDQGILPFSPEEHAKFHEIKHVPPGMGLASTRNRNQRKKLSRRLRDLIFDGHLPENSTIADMLEWEFGEAEDSFSELPEATLMSQNLDVIPWKSSSAPVENWQYRIELNAVECTDLTMRLPPPPFPFRQRWHRSQKRFLREQRNEYPHQKQIREELIEPILNYDEEPNPTSTEETNRESSPDLPSLPDDIDQLPIVMEPSNLEGKVIAFKRLTMVNWQPIMSDWQTARVDGIDGDFLQLLLARRDRIQSKKEYDEETGERIWGKFEMPNDEEQDTGILELDWPSLIEPRLILEQ